MHFERGRHHSSIHQPTHSRSICPLRHDSATCTGCVAYCESGLEYRVLKDAAGDMRQEASRCTGVVKVPRQLGVLSNL